MRSRTGAYIHARVHLWEGDEGKRELAPTPALGYGSAAARGTMRLGGETMLTRAEVESARRRSMDMLQQAGVSLSPEEEASMEVADYELGDLENQGLQVVVYENNDRYCASSRLSGV